MAARHDKPEGNRGTPWDLHLSGGHNPGPKRLDAIQEKLMRANIGLKVDPIAGADFSLKARIRVMPTVSFVFNNISGCRLQRSSRLFSDDDDDVLLIQPTHGAVQLNCGKRECFAGTGEHFLLSMAERTTIESVESAFRRSLKLKRNMLEPLVGGLDDHVLRPMDNFSPAFALMWSYVDALTESSSGRDPQLDRIACGHIYDLVAIALGGREAAGGAGVRAARLARIRTDLRANLCDPGLSLAWVAGRHGISTSYVKRLFEQAGISFTEFVLSERLKRAHGLLSMPGRSIADVAFASGFNDLSYFNRAFRRRFEATPSQVRREGQELA